MEQPFEHRAIDNAEEQKTTENAAHAPLDMQQAQELCASLKRIAVRSEHALHQGDAGEGIAQVERWVESYRRGLAAAEKISTSGIDLLQKTRDQLHMSLKERQRMGDEGSTSALVDEQAPEQDDFADAIRRIDQLLVTLHASFQPNEATPHAA